MSSRTVQKPFNMGFSLCSTVNPIVNFAMTLAALHRAHDLSRMYPDRQRRQP